VEHQNLPIPAFDVPGYEIHRVTTVVIAPTGGVKVNGSAPRSLEAFGIRDIQNHVPFFVGDRQAGPRAPAVRPFRRIRRPSLELPSGLTSPAPRSCACKRAAGCSRGVNVAKNGSLQENVGGEPRDTLIANGTPSWILIGLRQAAQFKRKGAKPGWHAKSSRILCLRVSPKRR
jgi:hypothetical protein